MTLREDAVMPAPRKLKRCRFLPYRLVRTSAPAADEVWIDVSSGAELPLHQLSPFYAHGGIPVPGMPGQLSDSVEGIWQGLKVIRGRIAPRYFSGGGRKRGGKPAGHQFGDRKRLLGIEAARREIYIPAYMWVLENRAAPSLIDGFVGAAFRGISQCFYDREDNGSISKDEPLAHARVLTDFVNARIDLQLGER